MSDRYPAQNPRVAYRVLDGSAVLINPDDSTLYTLNPVATRIWELADGQLPISEIARRLYGEFQVEQEIALRDMEAFLQAFQEKGLLSLMDHPPETLHG
ncbi:MAG: PqqD family protein [Nitrospirae bacterium]|nr:PqqD family protein [Nitrospirota bacterium]